MLDTNHSSQDEINNFAKSIEKKTKRLYQNNSKSVIRQAIHISPAYRDFVNKLLSNSYLSIKPYSGGFCRVVDHGEENNFSKRRKIQICVDFHNLDTFAHELGHATDFLFGDLCSFSSHVVVQDGKTLSEIFTEEFNEKSAYLNEVVLKEYAECINANIHEGAFDTFMSNLSKYRQLFEIKDPLTRKRIHKDLYESGFVEIYYQIVTKKCFKIIEQKYSPITDALSSKYELSGLLFLGHSIEYYKIKPSLLVEEFFANLFANKISANHTRFDVLIKLMPKSFNAFEKLFVMIYDRIQNNKRFLDLPLKGQQN